MEYEIIDMYEQGEQLRIKVDHDFGTDNIGLGLHTKKLNSETDEPRWKTEVEELLTKKYGDNSRKKKKISGFIGKKYNLDKVNIKKK